MASYAAISAVTQALTALFDDACPRDVFAGAQVIPVGARALREGLDFGLTVHLHQMTLDESSRRNLPPRRDDDGRLTRPPLPVDLKYVVTAWGRDLLMEHRLLGWAIRQLADTPRLPALLLNRMQAVPVFGDDEDVLLEWTPVLPSDAVNVWEAAKDNMRASVYLTARTVLIDSEQPFDEPPVVRVRDVAVGRMP